MFDFWELSPLTTGDNMKGCRDAALLLFCPLNNVQKYRCLCKSVQVHVQASAGGGAGAQVRGRAGKSAGQGAAVPHGVRRCGKDGAGCAPFRFAVFGTLFRSVPLFSTFASRHSGKPQSLYAKELHSSTPLHKEPHTAPLHAAHPPPSPAAPPHPMRNGCPLPCFRPCPLSHLCPCSPSCRVRLHL